MFSLLLLGDILLIHVSIDILILLEVEYYRRETDPFLFCNKDACRHNLAKS